MFSNQLYNKEDALDSFNDNLNKLSSQIKQKYEKIFLYNNYHINYQLEIISLNFIIKNYRINDIEQFIFSICFKNLMTIISSLKLIEMGFFGSANILFRNVYENLIIGKYVGLTKNYGFYINWNEGKQVSLKKDIFSKFKDTPSNEILEFWDILNKYNHATAYSAEFVLELDEANFSNCISILETLLIMNYHLLNNFVSKGNNYYLNYYFSDYYKDIKNKIKKIISFNKKNIDSRLNKVINEYIHNWVLK